MALFKARVVIGISRLDRCAFMTLTYAAGSPRLQNAGCVAKDWRALFRRFKLAGSARRHYEWMRVMELTKAGTPHHHLALGPIGKSERIRCWPGGPYGFDIRRYNRRWDRCGCLAHRWARQWYIVTGDSYIVHAMPVVGAVRAGAYMAKYMGKEFDGTRAEELGMARRWSSSRGWPGNGRLRLAQTEKGGWDRHQFAPGHWPDDVVGGPEDLLQRTGDDLTREMSEKTSRRRFVGKFIMEERDA